MRKTSFLKATLSLFIATLMLMVSACAPSSGAGQKTTEEPTVPVTDKTPSVDPIVIKHAFGETVIENTPERIATIGWGNHDVPLALGLVPVGISTANYGVTDGSGLLPWTKDAFTNLGVSQPSLFNDLTELDYEGIKASNPDVILAAYSGITQEEYTLLSEIAPVVAYPTAPWQTLWRDQITLNAQGMGRADQGNELVASLETFVADQVAAYPQLKDKTAAFFYFNPADLGKFYIYLPADPRAAFLNDLGLVVPESVQDLAKDATSFAIELSAENADMLNDIDLIVAYGDQSLLELMQKDALLGRVPAIQKGAVALIQDGTPLAAAGTPSALSIPATLGEYLDILGEAANRIHE